MKNLILVLFLFVTSCATTNTALKAPKFDYVKLDNGVQVYIIEDQSLPQFSIQSVLSKGSFEDESGKSGQAALTMAMLKEGSNGLSSDTYKDTYSKYSSQFDIDVEPDYVFFKSSGLSQYSHQIAELFLNTLLKPNFLNPSLNKKSTYEFSKVKQKRLAQISNSIEQANYFASTIFNSFVFDKSPYAYPEVGTESGVKKLQLADIQNYYKQYMQPESIQIALTGKFDAKTKQYILDTLKTIPAVKQASNKDVTLPKATGSEKTRIIVVDKPNLKQAEVRIGHLGPKRSNSDFIPLYIANSVVGSGDFNSLLMKEIRVKRGLVYGINSLFNGLKDAGEFVVTGSTRHDKVPELIQTTLQIIKDVKEKGVTLKNLQTQKNIMLGQFPMKFEQDDQFLSQIMRYKVYGLSNDYIQHFYEQIKNLNLNEANEVLSRNYKPDQSLIVVLGSKNELKNSLDKLGYQIEYVDYKNILK